MVKINEFFDTTRDDNVPVLNYDPGQDLVIFMQNDRMFYRKHLYPALLDLDRQKKANATINTKSLLPIVDQGIKIYCKKFNIPHDPGKIFDSNTKMQVIKALLNPETTLPPLERR
jgi:hypothetical protein